MASPSLGDGIGRRSTARDAEPTLRESSASATHEVQSSLTAAVADNREARTPGRRDRPSRRSDQQWWSCTSPSRAAIAPSPRWCMGCGVERARQAREVRERKTCLDIYISTPDRQPTTGPGPTETLSTSTSCSSKQKPSGRRLVQPPRHRAEAVSRTQSHINTRSSGAVRIFMKTESSRANEVLRFTRIMAALKRTEPLIKQKGL